MATWKVLFHSKIREWKGNEGYFTYTGNLVVAEEALRATAEQIAMYFEEMIGRTSTITVGTPAVGDIYLALDAESVLGDDNYAGKYRCYCSYVES